MTDSKSCPECGEAMRKAKPDYLKVRYCTNERCGYAETTMGE